MIQTLEADTTAVINLDTPLESHVTHTICIDFNTAVILHAAKRNPIGGKWITPYCTVSLVFIRNHTEARSQFVAYMLRVAVRLRGVCPVDGRVLPVCDILRVGFLVVGIAILLRHLEHAAVGSPAPFTVHIHLIDAPFVLLLELGRRQRQLFGSRPRQVCCGIDRSERTVRLVGRQRRESIEVRCTDSSCVAAVSLHMTLQAHRVLIALRVRGEYHVHHDVEVVVAAIITT